MSKKIYQTILSVFLLTVVLAQPGAARAWSGCGTSYTVQWGDTLTSIAANCGTTVSALRLANPNVWNWVYAGQVLVMPGAAWNNGDGYSTYIVAPGDTLRQIAARYGVTVAALASQNGIYNYDLIYVGQRLTIPSAGSYVPPAPQPSGATYIIQRGDTLQKLAVRWGVAINDILAVNPQIAYASLIYVGQVINLPNGSVVNATATYYTIQRGDTLRIIAARYGTSVAQLLTLNPKIWNQNLIYVGMVIRVQ